MMRLQTLIEISDNKELQLQVKNGHIFSAKKKQTMKIVTNVNNLVANSVFKKVSSDTLDIITTLNGHKEATAKVRKGDWIASGADNELYVIKHTSFDELYVIDGNIAIPLQTKFFLKVNLSNSLNWNNIWDESKSIPANTDYYLMANNEVDLKNLNMAELNPMAVDSFKKTY